MNNEGVIPFLPVNTRLLPQVSRQQEAAIMNLLPFGPRTKLLPFGPQVRNHKVRNDASKMAVSAATVRIQYHSSSVLIDRGICWAF